MVLDKTLNTSHWFKKNHIWLILGYKFKVKIMTKLKMKDFHVTLKPPEWSTTKHAQQYWVFDGLVGSAKLESKKMCYHNSNKQFCAVTDF